MRLKAQTRGTHHFPCGVFTLSSDLISGIVIMPEIVTLVQNTTNTCAVHLCCAMFWVHTSFEQVFHRWEAFLDYNACCLEDDEGGESEVAHDCPTNDSRSFVNPLHHRAHVQHGSENTYNMCQLVNGELR